MPDRYHTPPEGFDDWNVRLNENFAQLDSDVEHRAPTDPSSAGVRPTAGAKFVDTATGTIYLGDGEAWTPRWTLTPIGSQSGSIGSADDPTTVITNTHYREVTHEVAVAGDHTVDLTTANVHTLTLTDDTTLTFTGGHDSLTTGATLIIQQDDAGEHALTWGQKMYWARGTTPSLSANPGDRHKLVVECVAGDWSGAIVGENLTLVDPTEPDTGDEG